MKKFLIFTYHDDSMKDDYSFAEVGKLTLESKIDYCKIHGYDFYLKDKDFSKDRVIGYERIKIFLENIDSYDWLWYLDADAMIMNQTIRLENIIDDNYNMIIAQNLNNKNIIEINDGSILLKRSEWSKKYLNYINSLEDYFFHPWSCMQALIDYINVTHIEEAKKNIKIVHPRYFNSHYHEWTTHSNFKIGDFVLHAVGSHNNYRIKLFNEMKNKIIKVPKSDIATPPFV